MLIQRLSILLSSSTKAHYARVPEKYIGMDLVLIWYSRFSIRQIIKSKRMASICGISFSHFLTIFSSEFPEANMIQESHLVQLGNLFPFGIHIHCLKASTLDLSFKKKANLFLDLKREDETRWENIAISSLSCLGYLDSIFSLRLVPSKQVTAFVAFSQNISMLTQCHHYNA